jgi:predicted DNA-binding transcriptional regulator AlpA
MLNRQTKQVPDYRDRGVCKPGKGARVSAAFPPRDNSPCDLEPGFELLRSLIEARVARRLDEIFELVRRLEASGGYKASRRAIRLREVLTILGIGKSTLYSRLNSASPSYDPQMPRPFKLGSSKNNERAPSVWWESEVVAYLESCAQSHSYS